jgi:hypothetical protein
VTSVITGASSVTQVVENMKSLEVVSKLTDSIMTRYKIKRISHSNVFINARNKTLNSFCFTESMRFFRISPSLQRFGVEFELLLRERTNDDYTNVFFTQLYIHDEYLYLQVREECGSTSQLCLHLIDRSQRNKIESNLEFKRVDFSFQRMQLRVH